MKDLLRLAGLDARQESAEFSDCPTQTLIAGAVADLAPVIEARAQRVEIEVDPSVATIRTGPAGTLLPDTDRKLLYRNDFE